MFDDLKTRYQSLLQAFLYPQLNYRQSHLTTVEVIMLTYPSIILCQLLWFFFGMASFQKSVTDNVFMKMIAQNIPGLLLIPLYGIIFYSLFVFLIYPFLVLFSVQMWTVVITFFQRWTGRYAQDPTAAKDLAIACQSSNLLLVFPVFGSQLALLAAILQLLVGLHHRLKIGYGSAFLIICAPVLFLFLLILAGALIFSTFISAFF
jgi:hypothetical protein